MAVPKQAVDEMAKRIGHAVDLRRIGFGYQGEAPGSGMYGCHLSSVQHGSDTAVTGWLPLYGS